MSAQKVCTTIMRRGLLVLAVALGCLHWRAQAQSGAFAHSTVSATEGSPSREAELARARERPVANARVPRFVPTLGLGLFAFDETMRLTFARRAHEESRGDLFMAPLPGLWHPLAAPLRSRMRLDGHAGLGAGATFHSGGGRVLLREDAAVSYAAKPWLDLHGGVGLGLGLDTLHASRSQIELGVMLSVTLFRVEIAYRPHLSLPLGRSASEVFGGTLERSASTAFVPVDFVLRGQLRSLAW